MDKEIKVINAWKAEIRRPITWNFVRKSETKVIRPLEARELPLAA